jgi:hypothetical protein
MVWLADWFITYIEFFKHGNIQKNLCFTHVYKSQASLYILNVMNSEILYGNKRDER